MDARPAAPHAPGPRPVIRSLADLGWTAALADHARPLIEASPDDTRATLEVARVVGVERATFHVWSAHGPEEAHLAGTLRQRTTEPTPQPVIGDWLVVQRRQGSVELRILHVLPRRTAFTRAVNGGLAEQVITANVDVVFIVTTPGEDFDLPRLDRYITAVQGGGARPVVLLNKTDLFPDTAPLVEQLTTLAPAVPVHEVAATHARGLDALRAYLQPGMTAALIGSSGVGKSSLTNVLLGEDVAGTGSVRDADQQGRHTTTGRTLYPLPTGGLLIDNPGLRDIAVWDAAGRSPGFEAIEAIAAQCRFRKCTHTTEPGCAVKRAVQRGTLTEQALDAYVQAQGPAAPRRSRPGRS